MLQARRAMTDGVLGPRWAALEQQIDGELAAWRRKHQRATLTGIELTVEAVTARLHAALTAALAEELAARAAGAAAVPGARLPGVPGLWGRVPACGCFPPWMKRWASC